MIAIWIGIFLVIQAVVLVIVMALCKSAALADKAFDRAHAEEQKKWSFSAERGNRHPHKAPNTKPVTNLGYSRSDF